MREFEKLYHAEMYFFGHFLSDNLCHSPSASPMEHRRILQANKPKTQPTVMRFVGGEGLVRGCV